MKVDDFDFELPADRIALHPVEPRDAARMLVVRPGEPFADRHVTDLLDLLRPGDVLVVNDTKVLPAELVGTRIRGEHRATVSFNLHKRVDASTWRAFARPAKRLQGRRPARLRAETDNACMLGTLDATVAAVEEGGQVTLKFDLSGAFLDEVHQGLRRHAVAALYRAQAPRSRSATRPTTRRSMRRVDGAVAAPTAGLHFTEDLLQRLADTGVGIERVTLHVGAGTFLPVKVEDTADHLMHAEWGEITRGYRRAAARGQGQGRPHRRRRHHQPAPARKRRPRHRHAHARSAATPTSSSPPASASGWWTC